MAASAKNITVKNDRDFEAKYANIIEAAEFEGEKMRKLALRPHSVIPEDIKHLRGLNALHAAMATPETSNIFDSSKQLKWLNLPGISLNGERLDFQNTKLKWVNVSGGNLPEEFASDFRIDNLETLLFLFAANVGKASNRAINTSGKRLQVLDISENEMEDLWWMSKDMTLFQPDLIVIWANRMKGGGQGCDMLHPGASRGIKNLALLSLRESGITTIGRDRKFMHYVVDPDCVEIAAYHPEKPLQVHQISQLEKRAKVALPDTLEFPSYLMHYSGKPGEIVVDLRGNPLQEIREDTLDLINSAGRTRVYSDI